MTFDSFVDNQGICPFGARNAPWVPPRPGSVCPPLEGKHLICIRRASAPLHENLKVGFELFLELASYLNCLHDCIVSHGALVCMRIDTDLLAMIVLAIVLFTLGIVLALSLSKRHRFPARILAPGCAILFRKQALRAPLPH